MSNKSNINASELEKDIFNCVIYGNPDAVKALNPKSLNWFKVIQLIQESKGEEIEEVEAPDCSSRAEQIAFESYKWVLEMAEERYRYWLGQ